MHDPVFFLFRGEDFRVLLVPGSCEKSLRLFYQVTLFILGSGLAFYLLFGMMGVSQPARSDGLTFLAWPAKAKVLGW